jgi:hypothetical protein
MESERRLMGLAAMVAGLAAIFPGIFISIWAALLIPGVALVAAKASLLLAIWVMVVGVVVAVALPLVAIVLGGMTRRANGPGKAGWIIGWLALGLVVLCSVTMFAYATTPTYWHALIGR